MRRNRCVAAPSTIIFFRRGFYEREGSPGKGKRSNEHDLTGLINMKELEPEFTKAQEEAKSKSKTLSCHGLGPGGGARRPSAVLTFVQRITVRSGAGEVSKEGQGKAARKQNGWARCLVRIVCRLGLNSRPRS